MRGLRAGVRGPARGRGSGEGARPYLGDSAVAVAVAPGRPGSDPGSLSSAARTPAPGPARAAAPAPAPARAPAPAPAPPPPPPASACWRGPSPRRGRPARPGLAASPAARAYAPAWGEGPPALRSRRRARARGASARGGAWRPPALPHDGRRALRPLGDGQTAARGVFLEARAPQGWVGRGGVGGGARAHV